MTHHKRWGGRTLELILLFALILLSIGLIVGGFYLGTKLGGSKGPLLGIVIGGGIVFLLWAGFLEFYRYDRNTLRPIQKEEEK